MHCCVITGSVDVSRHPVFHHQLHTASCRANSIFGRCFSPVIPRSENRHKKTSRNRLVLRGFLVGTIGFDLRLVAPQDSKLTLPEDLFPFVNPSLYHLMHACAAICKEGEIRLFTHISLKKHAFCRPVLMPSIPCKIKLSASCFCLIFSHVMYLVMNHW